MEQRTDEIKPATESAEEQLHEELAYLETVSAERDTTVPPTSEPGSDADDDLLRDETASAPD